MAKFLTLSSGDKMPSFGLGTWKITKDEANVAITTVLDAGYRMIDTAYYYSNEQYVGEAIEEYLKGGKLRREDIFVTTKLPSVHGRPSDVKTSIEKSLRNLRLDYVDLYLIHTPFTCQNLDQGEDVKIPVVDGKVAVDETVDICDVWKAMEQVVDLGKAKHIGVSNFNSRQVEAICKVARIKPAVNQVECHPYLPQYELQAFCEERGILLTAYSPLGSPGRGVAQGIDISKEPVLMEDEAIVSLSKKYKKTPAQIVLRFCLQRGISIVPKSSNPSRIVSNFQVYDFQLTDDDMAVIETLQSGGRYFTFPNVHGRPSDVKTSIEKSLRNLRLDYVDLYLIHTPFTCQNLDQGEDVKIPVVDGKVAVDETVDICDVWKAMEQVVDLGKAKHIGVSNFNSRQVEAICKVARIKPAVNQVECHPYLPQYELQAFCEERGILLTAYSPLGSPGRGVAQGIDISKEPVLMEDEAIVSLSKKYKKTPAQIVLRFCLQRGISIVPKSSNPSRIVSNFQVYDFQLTDDDMAVIETLQSGGRYFTFPKFIGTREYPFDIPF